MYIKRFLLLLLYGIASQNFTCGGEGCGDNADCVPPISYSTELNASLSTADSVLRVGDTLRFYTHIPDTLKVKESHQRYAINQEKIIVGRLDDKLKSRVKVDVVPPNYLLNQLNNKIFIDSLAERWWLPWQLVTFGGQSGSGAYVYAEFKADVRAFECYFVCKHPGRYVLKVQSVSFGIVDKNDKKWLISADVNFVNKAGVAIPRRYNQFLNYVVASYRRDTKLKLEMEDNWYCFEVLR